jgi:hypothetical protein
MKINMTHPITSIPYNIIINLKSEIRKRHRFTIKKRFAIVQDLKALKCPIKVIAALIIQLPGMYVDGKLYMLVMMILVT